MHENPPGVEDGHEDDDKNVGDNLSAFETHLNDLDYSALPPDDDATGPIETNGMFDDDDAIQEMTDLLKNDPRTKELADTYKQLPLVFFEYKKFVHNPEIKISHLVSQWKNVFQLLAEDTDSSFAIASGIVKDILHIDEINAGIILSALKKLKS